MANGTFLRGEVYWVSLDNSVGSEIKTGRPAVVLSANGLNDKLNTVIVAFLTTSSYPAPTHPSVVSPSGVRSRVLCEQIRAIDKVRLVRYDYTLTEPELTRITGAIAISMCIPTAESVNTKYEEKIADLETEVTVLKRAYDKAIDKIVETKMAADILSRTPVEQTEDSAEEEPLPLESEIPEEDTKTEVEFEEPPELVDINTCSADDLKKCGCTLSVANTLISNRPYKSLEELRTLPGVTSVAYGLLKVKLCCIPVKAEEPPVCADQPVEKVNINTATGKELMEKLGINECYAYTITSYRNKNGRFVELEELKEVKKLPKVFYENYKDRLTIGEEPQQEPESELININTAKASELQKKTGLARGTCYCITKYRDENGPYTKLEDVLNSKISTRTLEKLRGKVEFGVVDETPAPVDETPTFPPELPKQEQKKVNINTASLRDLMAVGFEKRAAALIVNERRKFGNFRDLDELLDLPEISGKIVRKLRDKLEV